jgi:hypothetical protein
VPRGVGVPVMLIAAVTIKRWGARRLQQKTLGQNSKPKFRNGHLLKEVRRPPVHRSSQLILTRKIDWRATGGHRSATLLVGSIGIGAYRDPSPLL